MRTGGREVSHLMCTYVLALSVFMFLAAFFCLIVFCFICGNLTLPLFKKMCCQKRLFFSKEINSCRHEISFFCLTIFANQS